MLTIFGAPWAELSLEDVKGFLDQADDEPLLWEAKGTKLEKNEFDGVHFPDEPRTWIA